jgi:hypothetical protein
MKIKVDLLAFLLFFGHFTVAQNDSIITPKKILVASDLNIITYLTENDSTVYYSDNEPLTKYFNFELIDQKLYNAKKKKAVSFLLANTTAHKKLNGKITLPCKNKTVTFSDVDSEDETHRIYEYIGEINWLNTYLVYGMYWEDYDYKLIDKTSGEETKAFVDFPNISADKKKILSLGANVYENTADLDFYTIDRKKIVKKMNAAFKYWMPAGEITDMFWCTDGYFYLPVAASTNYWKPDGNLNDSWQYIRIKPVP